MLVECLTPSLLCFPRGVQANRRDVPIAPALANAVGLEGGAGPAFPCPQLLSVDSPLLFGLSRGDGRGRGVLAVVVVVVTATRRTVLKSMADRGGAAEVPGEGPATGVVGEQARKGT